LAGLSVAVQILAVSANYVNYEIKLREIYPTDWVNPLKYGPPALLNPLHGPVLGQVRLLWENAQANLDLGWVASVGVAWEVPAAAVCVALLAGLTWWMVWRRTKAWPRVFAAGAVVALLGLAALSAAVYGSRPEYGMPGADYAGALAEIERRAGPADGIVTIAPYHYQAPMARYRGRLPIYGYAAEPTPPHPEAEAVLWRALTRHPRLWLVTVGVSPADPANGIEAWLAAHAFKAEDRWIDDTRLVAFVTAGHLESLSVDARLGEQVRLADARISANTLRPGDPLAVELTWQAVAAPGSGSTELTTNLRGFVQLLSLDGQLVAGQDGEPGGGYAPGTGWALGVFITDRRGLLLPDTLAPGEYTLIAGLYDAATGQRLPVTDQASATVGDSVRLATVRME